MFVGRERECARIDLSLASADAKALVVRAPAGMGKTTLIRRSLETLSPKDVEIVHSAGVRSEIHLPFAGLLTLLSPLLDRLHLIAEPQKHAVERAFAIDDQPGGGPFAMAMATVSLLGTRDAGGRRVVAVVDDLHWLDAESRDCIVFAARRAKGQFHMLLGTRPENDHWFDDSVDIIDLAPLTGDESEALLRLSAPQLAPHIRNEIARAADGNPLAIVQMPHAMIVPNTNLLVDDVSAMVGPGDWSRLFDSRLDRLDEETLAVILTAAASGSEQAAVVLAAAGDESLAALESAEETGLLRLDGTTIRFTHPLLRTAVYARATAAQRRAAHRRLAEVTAGTERSWHLAAASAAPNTETADALDATGREALARRAPWLAADSFVRAAALTPEGGPHTARLAMAAEAAQAAGRGEYAAELARQVISTSTIAGERIDALMVASIGLSLTGHGMDAGELEQLVEEIADAHPAKATFSLAFLGSWRFYQFEFEAAKRDFEKAEHISGVRLPECHAILHAAMGNREAARQALIDLNDGRVALPTGWKWRAFLLEDYDELLHRIAVEDTSERLEAGEYAAVPLDRLLIGWVAYAQGRFVDATALLDDAHSFSALTGQRITGLLAVAMRARLRATVGEVDQARADLLPLCRAELGVDGPSAVDAAPVGHHQVPWFIVLAAEAALGFTELTAGNHEAALVALRRAQSLAEVHNTREPSFAPWALDLVEVQMRTGDKAAAKSVSEWLSESAEFSGSTSALSLASAVAGFVADDHDDEFFGRALEFDTKSTRPFHAARIQLLRGIRLHRENHRREARLCLGEAADAFDRLGAPHWAARAHAERLAAGGRRRETVTADSLTSQELAVARRAATGATVKHIATELFLSPKTVEWHLSSAYRKLDVHTRVGLADALRTLREAD